MFFFLILPVVAFYAGTRVQTRPAVLAAKASVYAKDITATEINVTVTQQPIIPDRAETVMKALSSAYPDRIGSAEFRDGDWAVPLGGKWFYYTEGRLLPEELRDKTKEYSGLPFYNYVAELPPWNPPSAEYSERMRDTTNQRRQTARRSTHFYDALWRIHNRDESWERVKQIRFLGHSVTVHYSILEKLSLVEEKILKEARTSSAVRLWVDSLKTVDGWSWRNIADSGSRSLHSYGVAVDILPKSTGGLETYWLWTAEKNPEWWAVPYSKRYHPPEEVIKAFEAYGFIWGGKWMVYDTMHFEYRPEIFILSNIPMADFKTDFSYSDR